MYVMDYHHHTDNSFDSKADMFEVCEMSIQRGINEICFTEHFSVNPIAPTYGHMDFKRYFNQIKACRDKFQEDLIIRAGIELCEPHLLKTEYEQALDGLEFDFILGSVHNIANEKLRIYLKNKEVYALYKDYFDEVYALVNDADIDVIAHFDLMKRYAIGPIGNYPFGDFKSSIASILEKAIDRGIGIEINTSGLNNTKLGETFPSFDVVKLYRDLGGVILTIGSDSHHAKTVGAHFKQALEMAKQAGFTHIYTFDKRESKPIKI
ncbi:histidinol-phosphatase HisJ family protein [Aquibacillus rhizosphaerae]|uniref:Histidinol-phosphatase n=1 Tax=Aquibacillus rhizosphaerae TaxID=3051431 RepID=A0ABT7LD24_9BACI|nr:histidinol-phosphatase HisJ family protein [Aquibacillus sp. LR5S19]MDL4843080.1 histidinol-phosphatase HisJ family protein [Aquibacillus sp. LR5S19]